MYFLDTSAILDLVYGNENGAKIRIIIANNKVATSVFSIYEISKKIKEKELVILAELFSILKLVEFDKESAFRSAVIEKELTKEGKMINLIDIFIASICKTNNFIMLTSDKDFKKIKGLKINLISR